VEETTAVVFDERGLTVDDFSCEADLEGWQEGCN
jgi:hypothetical protein